jgi:xanthine dehydrogenase accessory factor
MTKAKHIGLLGSRHKKALLCKALEDVGFPKKDIGRVVIPVGLPIESVTPVEIVVNIMAQIVKQRRANGTKRIGAASRSRLIQQDGADQTASPAR